MLKIMKASAGSGKTFTLAKEYIRLLMNGGDPYAYRGILAVTFTNKATEEMKSRILQELDTLATNPSESHYIDDLTEGKKENVAKVQALARKSLCNILNDYGAFSVSTIDRFFQRTLKAFSREIGQFASYQVELDKDSLVKESVDRILDSLTEDRKDLLKWLSDSAMSQLEYGGSFTLDKNLYETASAMRSDEHREAVLQSGIDEEQMYSREYLENLKQRCAQVTKAFVSDSQKKADAVVKVLDVAGVDAGDFNRGFMKQIYNYLALIGKAATNVSKPTDAFMAKVDDQDKWFAKSKAGKLLPKVQDTLCGPLQDFADMFSLPYKVYKTAQMLSRQIYSLGLRSEINEAFKELTREKNVLSLDDSNTILKGIIDGSDAPFIYEKLGVRYLHFLLDEFQDTSSIQWENFSPLVRESLSAGNDNLVVGDVKQSIYRWRNSDWELLNSKISEQFEEAATETLDTNWRSLPSIVRFNNSFYPFASALVDNIAGTDDLKSIYADVEQKVGKKLGYDGEGMVDIVFLTPSKEENVQLNAVLSEVERLKQAEVSNSDIGILVRTNREGADIAAALLAKGIPVISDESLSVKSSPAIRRLTALLSGMSNPDDQINSYLANMLNVKPPKEYHSIMDLCEHFLRGLRDSSANGLAGELPYIQAFLDFVQEWTSVYGNSLSAFLEKWKESDPKISSPTQADAVRIMTIHKSKGLSFPHVIFPFSDSVEMYRAGEHWCAPKLEGTSLEGAAEGVYRVNLSGVSEETLFADDYLKERKMQMVDAMNMYYVATTRAEKSMTIISEINESKKEAMDNAADTGFSGVKVESMAEILYCYCKNAFGSTSTDALAGIIIRMKPNNEENEIRYRVGPESAVPAKSVRTSVIEMNTSNFESWATENKCAFSDEAKNFFTDEVAQCSNRVKGIVLHDILSMVKTPADLDKAVEFSCANGALPADEVENVKSFLSSRIDYAKGLGWFPESGADVFNETSVIGSDGEYYRPDRVISSPEGIVIVDYKFGSAESAHHGKYLKQIGDYAKIYKEMGYDNVTAYLWYVYQNKVVKL